MDVLNYGASVAEIFTNDTFQQLVRETEERITDEWRAAESSATREACWYRLHGLRDFLKQMQLAMDAATIATGRAATGARQRITNMSIYQEVEERKRQAGNANS